jgi:phosphoheptose isomerase
MKGSPWEQALMHPPTSSATAISYLQQEINELRRQHAVLALTGDNGGSLLTLEDIEVDIEELEDEIADIRAGRPG